METKTYQVVSPVKFGGIRYAVGAPIELNSAGEKELRAVGVIGGEVASDTPQAPVDAAERIAAIVAAIGQLDKANAALWTGAGTPKTDGLTAITGWPVAAKERDAVWAQINAAK